jgi:hypothetical protein
MGQWIGLLLLGACFLGHGVMLWHIGLRIAARWRASRDDRTGPLSAC